MKNKILALLALVSLLVASMSVLASCGGNEDTTPTAPTHSHTFADEWKYDTEQHWHEATCEHSDEKGSLGAHSYEDGSEICSSCGYNNHQHTPSEEWTYDNDGHWHKYTCCPDVVVAAEPHTGFEEDNVCDVCQNHVHTFKDTYNHDEDNHWRYADCEHTEEMTDFGAHNGMSDCICDDCGYAEHKFESEWTSDETGHWHDATCSHDEKGDFMEHSGMSDGKCNVCGWTDPDNGYIELPTIPA